MIKILFICHGNICRSTMAQYLMMHLVRDAGYTATEDPNVFAGSKVVEDPDPFADFYIDSAATSREELGNPVDRRTVKKLQEHGVACGSHRARQIRKQDYDLFDWIILMDEENEWGIRRILPDDPKHKIYKLLEFASGREYHNRDGSARDVADPWYTHDFERTYKDLEAGCQGLLAHLTAEGRLARRP